MDFRPGISDLKTPEDIIKLVSALSEMADSLDVLYTTTAPNGSISARIGRIAIYNNGGTYEQWQNVDGATTWQRMQKFDSNIVSIASPVQGDVIYYNGTAWARLAAGTSGLLLKTQGAGANPLWALPADLAIASQAQGDVLYFNGTNWVRLAPGTSGQFLKTQGAGANPIWATSGIQIFTSSGTFTAPTGVTKVYISMCGGGGGGTSNNNGNHGGGAGGGYLLNYPFTVTPGNGYTVTIGAGGAAGNPASAGGTTSFDSISVTGGAGGTQSTTPAVGGGVGLAAASSTGGGPSFVGGSGSAGSGNDGRGGGGTPFGVGANGPPGGAGTTGNAGAANSGGGGSSGSSDGGGGQGAGGAGGSGVLVVMF